MDEFHVNQNEWFRIRLSSEQVDRIQRKIEAGTYTCETERIGPVKRFKSFYAVFAGLLAFSVAVAFIVHPGTSYSSGNHSSITKQIPATEQKSLNVLISGLSFRPKLPTWVPFKVTHEHGAAGPIVGRIQSFTVYIVGGSGDSELLQIQELGSRFLTSTPSTPTDSGVDKVKLQNGEYAYFGLNKSWSTLTWSDRGITYSILSGKADAANKHTGTANDLSEQQLVEIANSFR